MKKFFSDFALGIRSWFSAWGFIFSNGLAHYFIYPIVIGILMAMGAVAAINWMVEAIMQLIAPHLQYEAFGEKSWWQSVREFFSWFGSGAIKFLLYLASWFLYVKIGKYLVLAVMSPVMALLSERTEKILTGIDYPFNGPQFVRDVLRGILLAVRNLFFEMFSLLGLWFIETLMIFVAPPLALLLSPVFILLSFSISAYYFGFSTMDYTNERHKLGIGASVRKIRDLKGLAIGNGGIFMLLFAIPFLGACIATVTCTVAATLALRECK